MKVRHLAGSLRSQEQHHVLTITLRCHVSYRTRFLYALWAGQGPARTEPSGVRRGAAALRRRIRVGRRFLLRLVACIWAHTWPANSRCTIFTKMVRAPSPVTALSPKSSIGLHDMNRQMSGKWTSDFLGRTRRRAKGVAAS